jgi:hypothetical protein
VPLLVTDECLSPAALAPWIPRGIPHGHLPVGSASFLSRTRARSCCYVKDLALIVLAPRAACEEKDGRLMRICQAARGSMAGDEARRGSMFRWRGWCVALPSEGDARPADAGAAADRGGKKWRQVSACHRSEGPTDPDTTQCLDELQLLVT